MGIIDQTEEPALHSVGGQFDLQNLERIRKLRYIDDEFMIACFDENYEAVELVLQIILGKADLKIQDLKVQKVLKNLQGRSASIDVHAVDSYNKEYDIEIQRADAGAGARRARHNSSLLDAHILKAGQEPEEMPESYVIFITQNDVMKGNQPVYAIDRYVVIGDEKVLFGDGSHILYVNGQYRGDDAVGRLMHDFFCEDPNDMNFEELAKKARYFKKNAKGVVAMSKIVEDMMRDVVKDKARLMLKDGKLTIKEIPIYFQELSSNDIAELEKEVFQSA